MARRRGTEPPRRGLLLLGITCSVLVLVGATWIGVDLLRGDARSAEDSVTELAPAPREAAQTDEEPESDAATEPDAPSQPTRKPPPATAPAAIAPRVLEGVVVGIDAGHNGGNGAHAAQINALVDAGTLRKACDTTGTQTPGGYTEAEYNLDVARRLQRILERSGARVVMVRSANDGWGPCIDERARITNTSDVAVSIHADGNLGSGARGFHVIVPQSVAGLTDDIAAPSDALGRSIRDAMRAGTTLPTSTYLGRDGIDVRDDLGGLNLSDVPKVLVETGNMKSDADRAVLETPAGRQRIAQAIADGIAAWHGE